jgi:hypothetical protein
MLSSGINFPQSKHKSLDSSVGIAGWSVVDLPQGRGFSHVHSVQTASGA